MLAAAMLAPKPARSRLLRGTAQPTVNANRVTINVPKYVEGGFINIAKQFTWNVDPLNMSSDGYPVTAPTAGTYGCNPNMPGGYFGDFVLSWSGTGGLQMIGAPPMIISSGSGLWTGNVSGPETPFQNMGIFSTSAPSTQFRFGVSIQAITDSGVSNGQGGTYILITTKTGYASYFEPAHSGSSQPVNISGITTQTNANGTWAPIWVDDTHFYLGLNQITGAPSVWSSAQGAGGVAGQAVIQVSNLAITMAVGGTWSSFGNLVWCKSANLAALQAGQIADPELVSELRYLQNPGGAAVANAWLRTMDVNGAQGNWNVDFTKRMPVTYISYSPVMYIPAYLTSSTNAKISWSAGDAYTCANPSASGSGAYADGEVVQGFIDFANQGPTPTINIGGRGAAPLINTEIRRQFLNLNGALPTAGNQSVSFTFSASWLNSGTPYVFTYKTVQNTATFTGSTSGSGSSGTLTVTAVGANPIIPGSMNLCDGSGNPTGMRIVSQVSGTTGGVGTYNVAGAVFALGSQSLQGKSPHGDDTANFRTLYGNFQAAFVNDLVLAAGGVQYTQNGITGVPGVNYTAAPAGALTITYTAGPSGLLCTIGQLEPQFLAAQLLDIGPVVLATLSGSQVTGDVVNVVFTRGDLPGGAYTLPYTVQSSDTSMQSVANSIGVAINADATLSAHGIRYYQFGLPANAFGVTQANQGTAPNNGQQWDAYTGGGLTLSVSKASGTGTYSAVLYASNTPVTLIYNYLMGGFLCFRGGYLNSAPYEYLADLCNRTGCHLWYNWGTNSASLVTAITNFFAANLNAGLKFGTETGNEVWNSGANPYGQWIAFGIALGTNNFPQYSYTSLRTAQYAALSTAAWTGAGRAAGDHYIFSMSAEFDNNVGNGFDTYQLQGTQLNNSLVSSYGGLGGGTTSLNFNAFPNRAVDWTTHIGLAPYWGSPWWGGTPGTVGGNVGTPDNNSVFLQAALDYANTLTATAFTSLANQFNGTTTRPNGSWSGIPLNSSVSGSTQPFNVVFAAQNTLAANYDGTRKSGYGPIGIMHYEGGPNFGLASNGNNGLNSPSNQVASFVTADVTALANQMIALGWNVSAYTKSTTDNKTEMAQMVLQLIQGWKFDVDVNGNAANTGSYKNMIKTNYYAALKSATTGGRDCHPAQYGYGASMWGLWPGVYGAGSHYANYDAIHEWNT